MHDTNPAASSSPHAPLSQAQLVQAHDQLGRFYWLGSLAWHAEVHRLAARRAALRSGERFLEVGVGSGGTFLPLVLANREGDSQGIDLSRTMLARCRARLARSGARGFQLQQADARSLPYPSAHFDLLVCCYLLDALSLQDQQRALAEFARVLRPGGRLLLTNMTEGSLPLYPVLSRRLPRLLGGARPVTLATALLELGLRDVSRLVYRRLGFSTELLRGVRV